MHLNPRLSLTILRCQLPGRGMHALLLKKLAGSRTSTGICRFDALEGLTEFLELLVAHVGDSSLTA